MNVQWIFIKTGCQKRQKEKIYHNISGSDHPHTDTSLKATTKKREKFTNALTAVVSLHKHTTVLRLVKFWDGDNTNLFLQDQYRFTTEGLSKYWLSVDAAIRFWCIALFKKNEKDKKKMESKSKELTELEKSEKSDNTDYGKNNYQHRKKHSYDEQQANSSNRDYHYENNHYDNNYRDYDYDYRDYNRDPYQSRYKWKRNDYYKSSRRLPYR